MPKLLPQITATDKFVQRVSKGRVTILDIAGLPNLMLTVKGRKSGVPRTTPLLCVPHEARQPDRRLQLRRAEDAGLGGQRPGRRRAGRVGRRRARTASTARGQAREVTGEERDRLWEDMMQDLAQLREVRRAHRPHHPGLPASTRST